MYNQLLIIKVHHLMNSHNNHNHNRNSNHNNNLAKITSQSQLNKALRSKLINKVVLIVTEVAIIALNLVPAKLIINLNYFIILKEYSKLFSLLD